MQRNSVSSERNISQKNSKIFRSHFVNFCAKINEAKTKHNFANCLMSPISRSQIYIYILCEFINGLADKFLFENNLRNFRVSFLFFFAKFSHFSRANEMRKWSEMVAKKILFADNPKRNTELSLIDEPSKV